MTMHKPAYAARLTLLLFALIVALLLAFGAGAQGLPPVPVPSCCGQMLDYKHRYEATKIVLDSTRDVGDRLLLTKDRRIEAVQKQANAETVILQKQANSLSTRNETLGASLDECNSLLGSQTTRSDSLQHRLNAHEPKTWFGRQRKKATSVATVAGFMTIIYGLDRIVSIFFPH